MSKQNIFKKNKPQDTWKSLTIITTQTKMAYQVKGKNKIPKERLDPWVEGQPALHRK